VTLAIQIFESARARRRRRHVDEYWFGRRGPHITEAPCRWSGRAPPSSGPGRSHVALNIAALGAHSCSRPSVVGSDERGQLLTRLLEQRGVRCELVRSPTLPTIHKLRVLLAANS